MTLVRNAMEIPGSVLIVTGLDLSPLVWLQNRVSFFFFFFFDWHHRNRNIIQAVLSTFGIEGPCDDDLLHLILNKRRYVLKLLQGFYPLTQHSGWNR